MSCQNLAALVIKFAHIVFFALLFATPVDSMWLFHQYSFGPNGRFGANHMISFSTCIYSLQYRLHFSLIRSLRNWTIFLKLIFHLCKHCTMYTMSWAQHTYLYWLDCLLMCQNSHFSPNDWIKWRKQPNSLPFQK